MGTYQDGWGCPSWSAFIVNNSLACSVLTGTAEVTPHWAPSNNLKGDYLMLEVGTF